MKFKPGNLYRFHGLWNPFRVKPHSNQIWSDFKTWPKNLQDLQMSKRFLLYLGTESWYGCGELHKFYYNEKIVYFYETTYNNPNGLFEEIETE